MTSKDDPRPRRYFLCTGEVVTEEHLYKYPESHVLGDLRYVTDEGRRVTGLALWDVPVSAATVPPLKPFIRAYMIGDARLIRCTICGRYERWEIGRMAMLSLMDRMGLREAYLKREKNDEIKRV